MIAPVHPRGRVTPPPVEYDQAIREQYRRPSPDADSSAVQVVEIRKRVERWIKNHPAASVGVAAAVGVTLGLLLKRRTN